MSMGPRALFPFHPRTCMARPVQPFVGCQRARCCSQEGIDVENLSCRSPSTPAVRNNLSLFYFESSSIRSEIEPFAENVGAIFVPSPEAECA